MESTKPTESNSIGKIEKVDLAVSFNQSTGNRWISILKAFNPLGHIADAYAQTLAYKIETKRLDAELTRIEEQAKIAHNVIDKTFRLKIEELEQRRVALIGFYQTVNNQLERLHIEKMTVMEMAKLAQQKSFESGISFEEKKLFYEMTKEIVAQIPVFGEKANESLKVLVQALPPVQIPAGLLSDGNSAKQ